MLGLTLQIFLEGDTVQPITLYLLFIHRSNCKPQMYTYKTQTKCIPNNFLSQSPNAQGPSSYTWQNGKCDRRKVRKERNISLNQLWCPEAPRETKGGLNLIPGSRSLSRNKKAFKNVKDLANHSKFIKAIVRTWEVRVGDLGELEAPMGSWWKVFTKRGQGVDRVVLCLKHWWGDCQHSLSLTLFSR